MRTRAREKERHRKKAERMRERERKTLLKETCNFSGTRDRPKYKYKCEYMCLGLANILRFSLPIVERMSGCQICIDRRNFATFRFFVFQFLRLLRFVTYDFLSCLVLSCRFFSSPLLFTDRTELFCERCNRFVVQCALDDPGYVNRRWYKSRLK